MMVHAFRTIDNLRDLGESIPIYRGTRLHTSLFFRSATLDVASDEELELLVKELQIKTILDLRSDLEAKLAASAPFSAFPITASLKLDPSDILDPDPYPDEVKIIEEISNFTKNNRNGYKNNGKGCENCVSPTTSAMSRKTIMVDFAGRKFRKCAVWMPAPFWCKIKIACFALTGQKVSAAKLACVEVMNKKGLDGLYRDFIDYCHAELNEALHILANPSNYPVLVHCTHGKDRTGIVVALALAAIGVEESRIIEDYAKSTVGLTRVRPKIVEELSHNGLDPRFADTPAEVMQATLDYIKTKFGSICEYLDAIGFCSQSRELLKLILVEDQPNTPEKLTQSKQDTEKEQEHDAEMQE